MTMDDENKTITNENIGYCIVQMRISLKCRIILTPFGII